MGKDFYWVYPYDSANPDANVTENNWMYSKGGIPYVSFDAQHTKRYAKIVVALVLNGKGNKICIKDEYNEVYTANFLIEGVKKEIADNLYLDINDGDDEIDKSDSEHDEDDK
jgi:hypothetical protein